VVGDIIQKLDDLGILDNTYVIYTSDNGFHLGNHRLKAGKRLPYEEDVNIPLLIRGPGVAKNVVTNRTNSHTDMAPTILQMLGIPLREDFDGAPIPYTSQALKEDTNSEVMTVEFWTALHPPVGFTRKEYYNNTYRAIRLASDHYSLYYAVWCSGEREFYDMKSDSAQMNNSKSTK
jgi:arylsulfatase